MQPLITNIRQGVRRTIGTLGCPWFVMGCKYLMTYGDLENRSRSTKFNRVLTLPKVKLNMKAVLSKLQFVERSQGSYRRREGQTTWVMTIPSGLRVITSKRWMFSGTHFNYKNV